MKVTVGAIRQIVREEAERLNESDEVDAPAGLGDQALALKIKNSFITGEFKDILSATANPLNVDIYEIIKDILEQARDNKALFNTNTRRLEKQTAVTSESVARDELRNLIMAEAAELVQS